MAKHKHEFPLSSSISNVEYDDETKDMHIEFVSGGRHCFKNVMKDDFDGFATTDSPGKHFHINIRKVYKSEKVD